MTIGVLRRPVLDDAGMWAGSITVLLGLVAVGVQSMFAAFAAISLAVLLVLVVCLGLERAGTLLVIIAMFLAPSNDLRLGASYVTISDVVFVLGFAILAPGILRNTIRIPALFLVGLGVLLVMGAISSAAAPIPIVSISQLIRLMIGAFALPIIFMVWRPSTQMIVRFAAAYMLGTVLSVGYGLTQGPVAGDARYIGLTYHPNYLGISCLLAASLVPYVTAKVAPQLRWIFWGAGLVSAYGVWISGSRAALIVLIMLIAIYPFVERSVRAGGAVLLGVTIALAFSGRLLQEDGNSALGRLFGGGTATGSDIERRNVLSAAWQQFTDHPILGNGFDGGIGSHNIYLQVAVAVGIFGLVGYLFIIWSALRPLFWEGTGHRLAYPVLAYAAIGPLTNTLWERMIWAVLALVFVADARRPGHADPEPVQDRGLVKEGT